MKATIITAAILLTGALHAAHACSTFYLENDGKPVFGKNYDWNVDVGLVVVNKRGVLKTAMPAENPARWVSKYGSVTFNQYGRELPAGGMNEAGLVVELMWLDEAEYPLPDDRPAIGNVQWIQYQLDNSRTVGEVIASDEVIRISRLTSSRIHYLVGDAEGNSAAIEFIEGQMVAHTGEAMPAKALTNDTYRRSMEYLSGFEGFGGGKPLRRTRSSLDRFAHAADRARGAHRKEMAALVDYGFEVLSEVAQGEFTKWSIVYDIAGRRAYFRTARTPDRRYVDLGAMDFSCDTPVLILDINAGGKGDTSGAFVEYSYDANFRLVRTAFRQTDFLSNTPDTALQWLAQYPGGTTCQTPSGATGSGR